MRESAFHSKWAPAPNPWAGGLVPAARASANRRRMLYETSAPSLSVWSLSSNGRADLNSKYILRAGEKMSGAATGPIFAATGPIFKVALASNRRFGDRS